SRIVQRDGPAVRPEGRRLVERHVLRARRVDEAREGVDGAALITDRDPNVGAWVDDRERLRAGLYASAADAFEPRPDIVGGDEVDNAGGVNETAQEVDPRAGPGKTGEHDQTDSERTYPRRRPEITFHLQLLSTLDNFQDGFEFHRPGAIRN